jgi:hypothetical protein
VVVQSHLNASDYQWYVVTNSTTSIQPLDAVTFRPIGGATVDTFIELYDLGGAPRAVAGNDTTASLVSDDDHGEGPYSHLRYMLAPGAVYFVRVHPNVNPAPGTGDYALFMYSAPGVVFTSIGSTVTVTIH